MWAEAQLIVADEFRDGKVAGGEDPRSSVQRAFNNLPAGVTERFFRGDTAADYAPLLKYLVAEKIGFTIGADMTRELRTKCLAMPDDEWVLLEKRAAEEGDGRGPRTSARDVPTRLTTGPTEPAELAPGPVAWSPAPPRCAQRSSERRKVRSRTRPGAS